MLEGIDTHRYNAQGHGCGAAKVHQDLLSMWDAIVFTCPSRESAVSLRKGSSTSSFIHLYERVLLMVVGGLCNYRGIIS